MKYFLIVSSNCFESVEAENSCKHCRQNPAQCTHFLQGKIRTQEISSRHKNNKSSPFEAASVPPTELFSNNFMEDLEKIWELRTFIPDPTTPPVLYRNSDAEDVD